MAVELCYAHSQVFGSTKNFYCCRLSSVISYRKVDNTIEQSELTIYKRKELYRILRERGYHNGEHINAVCANLKVAHF